MKTQTISSTDLQVSRIAYGCMGIGGGWDAQLISVETRKTALNAIRTALDEGINFFDHADFYCLGKSEEVFSSIWQEQPSLREQIYLQSKCGIRLGGDPAEIDFGRYDFSHEHILHAVEGSLKRLKTDYLDLLLLHRPDPLVEPEEVARAFDDLMRSGKVRHFGVSNHNAAQIAFLQKYLDLSLVVNQVELSLMHLQLIDEGVVFNQDEPAIALRGEGTLEYCRLHDITLQAWGPLAYGVLSGKQVENPSKRIIEASARVAELACRKNVSREAIVIAWLLRHPAHIQPIIGTTAPVRIRAACQADSVELSREEWYWLFIAGRGDPMP